MKIQLVCTDMDGTLFSDAGVVSEPNCTALRACEARGIHLAFVSGRGCDYLHAVAARIGVSPAIAAMNGARIEASPSGESIGESVFSPALGARLIALLLDSGVYFEAYTGDVNFAGNPRAITDSHARAIQSGNSWLKVELCADAARLTQEASSRSYKMVAFSDECDRLSALRQTLARCGFSHTSSSKSNIEIMPPGVDKGYALRAIARYFGVPLAETMAFGDYENDIEMLKTSGVPVAMANGLTEVKALAKIVAPNHRESGVAAILNQYVFKETDGE